MCISGLFVLNMKYFTVFNCMTKRQFTSPLPYYLLFVIFYYERNAAINILYKSSYRGKRRKNWNGPVLKF